MGPPLLDVQGVLYSHRANFLHAMVICMPDCLDLKSNSSVLAVVPMCVCRGGACARPGAALQI